MSVSAGPTTHRGRGAIGRGDHRGVAPRRAGCGGLTAGIAAMSAPRRPARRPRPRQGQRPTRGAAEKRPPQGGGSAAARAKARARQCRTRTREPLLAERESGLSGHGPGKDWRLLEARMTADISARRDDAAVAGGAPVIEAQGLGLTFETADGPVHALRDVNLAIGKGDFVSFIGPSGCGKTTFLRVAADLETPTAGTITVNGMSPAAGAADAGLRLRLPGGGAVSLADDRRQRPAAAGDHGLRPGRAGGAGEAGAGAGRARRLREEVSLAALGRHAAAGVDRPGAGVRRRHPADGRAVRGARRDRPRPAERGAAASSGRGPARPSPSSPTRSPRRCSSRPGSW